MNKPDDPLRRVLDAAEAALDANSELVQLQVIDVLVLLGRAKYRADILETQESRALKEDDHAEV